ncbi:helix-turn-helix domain-containing protein [Isoptericola nanjingensis]|uniref:helix-turn-helix domain-containing protein n=1 Tax=Isoptericola nanjingensis TaxID=903413 RepID=UPI003D21A77F
MVDLRAERERAGLAQTRLAELAGIAPSNLSAYESGKRPVPAARTRVSSAPNAGCAPSTGTSSTRRSRCERPHKALAARPRRPPSRRRSARRVRQGGPRHRRDAPLRPSRTCSSASGSA